MAGIRQLVAAKIVDNDNNEEMGTNVGAVKEEFLFSYWVYLFRYPTASSHPRKLTLNFSFVRCESH